MSKREISISKYLSLVLCEHPEKSGLQLNQNGWTDVQELIEKANIFL